MHDLRDARRSVGLALILVLTSFWAPPFASAQTLHVGSAVGTPGQLVSFSVTLTTGGASIAGVQNDIAFDPVNAPIVAGAQGHPLCVVNSAIGKEGTSFSFLPPNCSGSGCLSIRVIVFSLTQQRTDT
jgi:hypothetical protein